MIWKALLCILEIADNTGGEGGNAVSVTVEDILKLPSLRQAKVLGGAGGLKKVVSSISVLEATDPSVLVKEVFPQDKYFGSEIVITGFLNCIHDVDR